MNVNGNTTVMIAWIGYLGVVIYLANMMGAVAIPFAAIMMVPLIVMMSLVWGKRSRKSKLEDSASATMQEKRKRERIDNMLRDMSDEELYELRQRLQDRAIDIDDLYDGMIGDDGEMVMRQ